ncbi:hypothetical protein AC1031_006094 [Aphanomyces cochlioides]|nr:hypothetical protein AC1031_006094 [Aphanomyces cochlioides]
MYVRRALNTLSDRHVVHTIHLNKQTTPANVQGKIMAGLERKMKGLYGPSTGKQAAIYQIEDLHLSQHECQEQLRQIVDIRGVYNRQLFDFIELSAVVIVGLASWNRSNSFLELPRRLVRHFHLIWCPQQSPDTLFQTFKSLPSFLVERFAVPLSIETCWKSLQVPLLLLQAAWGHSFQSPHAIFTLGDLINVYSCLLRAVKLNFETKRKLESSTLYFTRICFHSKMCLSCGDERSYDMLISPILEALEYETVKECCLFPFTNKGDGNGYSFLNFEAASKLILTGEEKFQWHHPNFKDPVLKEITPFPSAIDHVIRILISLSDIKSHCLLVGE